jgi:hypothetical protein
LVYKKTRPFIGKITPPPPPGRDGRKYPPMSFYAKYKNVKKRKKEDRERRKWELKG